MIRIHNTQEDLMLIARSKADSINNDLKPLDACKAIADSENIKCTQMSLSKKLDTLTLGSKDTLIKAIDYLSQALFNIGRIIRKV